MFFFTFIQKFTENEDDAVVLVMDYLPIQAVLIDNIQQTNSNEVFISSLNIIGNIISCNNQGYTELLYKYSLMQALTTSWQNYQHQSIYDREFCWVYSNLVASNNIKIVKEIIYNEFIFGKIIDCLRNQNPYDYKEAVHVIKNMIMGYGLEITEILIREKQIFQELIPFLDLNRNINHQVILIVLKTLDTIFRNERIQDSNQFYLMFERIGGIDEVETLQSHKNNDVYEMCSDLLKDFGEA